VASVVAGAKAEAKAKVEAKAKEAEARVLMVALHQRNDGDNRVEFR